MTTPSGNATIQVDHLTVAYGTTTALHDVSLSLSSGTMTAIIGPNGAGKSTLLQALLGMVRPLSGSILFGGKPFAQMRNKIAYVPQKDGVDWDFPMSVFDFVLMGRFGYLGALKWYRKADRLAVDKVLQKMGLSHLAHRHIGALSGGQQKRIFLARALVQEAEIYFLDEPFASVDKGSEEEIILLLRMLCQQGKSVIAIHHDLATLPTYFETIVALNTVLIGIGPVATMYTSEMIQRIFGKQPPLFDEILRLSAKARVGLHL